jgi:2-polyprenyl-3-methyl-5-hydroxy-6-metoxy-1,4-benzoquinol methylase
MRRARRRMRYLSRFVPGGAFLDIGCNGGFMVEAARERGFDAQGLDIDGVSIAYARRHYPKNTFFHGTIESYTAVPEALRFDLVYCSEVIEHLPDVQGFTAAVAGLLRPGGVFFVTTPDISHWRRPRDLPAWDAFCPPSHCIYFNPDSLRLLLERHGLRVVRRRLALKPGIKLICRKS